MRNLRDSVESNSVNVEIVLFFCTKLEEFKKHSDLQQEAEERSLERLRVISPDWGKRSEVTQAPRYI